MNNHVGSGIATASDDADAALEHREGLTG